MIERSHPHVGASRVHRMCEVEFGIDEGPVEIENDEIERRLHQLQCTDRRELTRILVEAAGVEPASEKARPARTTCVSDSVFVGCPRLNRQDTSSLARLISASGSEQKPSAHPAEMTLTDQRTGPRPERLLN